MAKSKLGKVIFRRINGRIVPVSTGGPVSRAIRKSDITESVLLRKELASEIVKTRRKIRKVEKANPWLKDQNGLQIKQGISVYKYSDVRKHKVPPEIGRQVFSFYKRHSLNLPANQSISLVFSRKGNPFVKISKEKILPKRKLKKGS